MNAKICKGNLCKGEKPPTTNYSPKANTCRECCNEKMKQYHKEKGRAYRNFKNEIKANSACVICGCKDIRLLEFDHLGEKKITIAKSFSSKAIQEESASTQILCVWCHRLKSREGLDAIRKKLDDDFESARTMPSVLEGRVCLGPLCDGRLRDSTHFYKKSNGILRNKCKTCHSYRERLVRDTNIDFVNTAKIKIGKCELCDVQVTPDTTCAFDFDHLRDKIINVSMLVRLNGDKRQEIKEEVQKCRLLCCKCHKLHTTEQQGFHYESLA